MSTAVVCDTTAYFPEEVLSRYGIREVSLYVTLEGLQQRESEIADLGEYYARLAASGETVTTSQPSVGDFIEAYEPLLADGGEIVSVHLSASISGTFETAQQARQRLIDDGKGGERIHVIDSRSAAGGYGLVALAAAKTAADGADAETVVRVTEQVRDSVMIWFALDTLEYLRRGGRIGAAGALLGSALKIKPILTFGVEVKPVERVRTTSRARARLRDYARQHHEAGANFWVVQHVCEADTAALLVDDCREIFGSEPGYVSELGPVLGAHSGPGMLGVGGAVLPEAV